MKAIKEQVAKAMKAMKGAYGPGSGGGRCHETIARAYAGAVMAEKGAEMTIERWEALRQFAGGCLPHWEAVDRKTGARVRGVVNETIGYVQGEMANAVAAWRARAQGGLEWQRERIEKREWLRLIMRAWRDYGVRVRRASGGDNSSELTAYLPTYLHGGGHTNLKSRHNHVKLSTRSA